MSSTGPFITVQAAASSFWYLHVQGTKQLAEVEEERDREREYVLVVSLGNVIVLSYTFAAERAYPGIGADTTSVVAIATTLEDLGASLSAAQWGDLPMKSEPPAIRRALQLARSSS